MKKYILVVLFFLVVVFLTFNSVSDENLLVLLKNSFNNIDKAYIIILFGVILLYFLLQGLYMKTILGSLNTKISLLRGMFYSVVEFYFSGITPSSTAGQPMQLYFMTKDKIPVSNTYITLILNTIFFKLIMVGLGIWILLFNNTYLFNHSSIYIFFFVLGIIFDLALTIIGFLLLFHQNLIKKLFSFFIKLGKKIPFFKKKVKRININETFSRYKDQINYIKTHKLAVCFTFLLTLCQRLLLFSVAYLVIRGLGYNSVSYLELLAIQVTVQITIEAYPLPGGTGISESMFKDFFITLFGIGVAEMGMLSTRLFAYYIPLLISGIIVLTYYIIKKVRHTYE